MRLLAIAGTAIGFVLTCALVIAVSISTGRAHENCAGFIDINCCCSANACFVLTRADIVRVTETQYRIVRTGELVEAKGRSPDGTVRRCTGDRDANGHWSRVGHPDAKTNCLYVTETGS